MSSGITLSTIADYEAQSIALAALPDDCMLSIDRYLEAIQGLLPPGPAWTREADANLTALLEAFAAEFKDIGDSDCQLLKEMHPLTSTDMIEDWETSVGIPDCVTPDPTALTIHQRRAHVMYRLALIGCASSGHLLDVLSAYGYTTHTINEFSPFRAGESLAGDILTNDGDFGAASTIFQAGLGSAGTALVAVNWPGEDTGWTYAFQLTGLANPASDDPVFCLIEKYKPAHILAAYIA